MHPEPRPGESTLELVEQAVSLLGDLFERLAFDHLGPRVDKASDRIDKAVAALESLTIGDLL